ncbi:hypothetical protein GCM10010168_20750 [Actinoplanes ianthinogenes]|uniref:Uncharacterized protein n=1 Tax=Actinoplanes ianthinogenes TaxID=122358 RepID=A0ABN6CRA6_9ACTN|nr:hypothetical protein [Actinoplanes ianthinogenes]BCJ47716.1 hypothetical protein Aiant_83730 [Actinoplanes ianthinogenes]GGR03682.1 hypothetical protein GCM10010168_20750 [Actinoplanes ianthinogenes]
MSGTDATVSTLRRPAPGWVAPLFAVLGAATIPWTVYLSLTLPQRTHTGNYRVAWVGFDVLLVIGLLATAYLAWRGRQRVGLLAGATATLLVVDAWFDVTLSTRSELTSAIVSAVLIEIPLAVLCGWIALHVDRLVEHRLRRLARQTARLRAQTSALTLDSPRRLRGEARLQQILREQALLGQIESADGGPTGAAKGDLR